jgi:HAD superfamily hydrolase (TIGR01509 family)
MIKLVLFDLDGVLIDAKEIHYKALNDALPAEYRISRSEHINTYDGKKTTEKLRMLTERKGLPVDDHSDVSVRKQHATLKLIAELDPIEEICCLFKQLEDEGYTIGVCTNSVRRTALTALARGNLMQYVSLVVSNEDVHNSKPHPEMYWKAMSVLGRLPEETLIVEDSPPGLLAAERSKANYIRVTDPYDVTCDKIMPALRSGKQIKRKWENKSMNVLIPMAGAGSRFAQAGYTFPKPLIDVQGKPMIQVVVENLGMDANYIFVVQKEHREKYALDTLLNMIAPKCRIVEVNGMTDGAACTALLAKEFIDNDEPLFFANSDQYVEWNPVEFMYEMQERDADGGIVTFKATHPKWSFAKVDGDGLVTEVAEKNPISDNATVGFYYWKRGSDFVKYAEQMIDKEVRVNNEFYVCPVFNEAIADDMKIRTFEASKMWGIGTPEDLNEYLRNN